MPTRFLKFHILIKCALIAHFRQNLTTAVRHDQIWLKCQLDSVSSKLSSSPSFRNITSVINTCQSVHSVIGNPIICKKDFKQYIQGTLCEYKKAIKDVEMAPQRVIFMSCGSYNPPTNMHLRMFEVARDYLHKMGPYVVVGGIISPVHDGYNKKDLVSSFHRCAMLKLALQNSDWIHLSTWETKQNCWTKTKTSLQYHQNLLNSLLLDTNEVRHKIPIDDTDWIPENIKNSTDCTPIQIKLLCGADLLESFGIPGLWMDEDIEAIISQHGLVVVTREGTNVHKFIYDSDILSKHMQNISIVTEWIPNEISSTRIRRALKRGESVRYLMQDSVIDYVYRNGIYNAKTTTTFIGSKVYYDIINKNSNIEDSSTNESLISDVTDSQQRMKIKAHEIQYNNNVNQLGIQELDHILFTSSINLSTTQNIELDEMNRSKSTRITGVPKDRKRSTSLHKPEISTLLFNLPTNTNSSSLEYSERDDKVVDYIRCSQCHKNIRTERFYSNRDDNSVKMMLTKHDVKIISEKETTL